MSVGQKKAEAGISLLPTMMTICILSMALGSYLILVTHNNRLTVRAQAWKAALPLAEAGVEEALAHLNVNGYMAADGWKADLAKGTISKKRPMSPGYFEVSFPISASSPPKPPIVTAKGYIPLPLTSNYITRTVQVETRINGWGGILCRNKLVLSGSGTVIDSYDPTDPKKSTLNRYDPAKKSDRCFVGTISPQPGNLEIHNHHIYGKAGTAAGGTISVGTSGKVGTTSWNQLSNTEGKIQSGHFTDDLNLTIPMPSPPFTGNAPKPASGLFSGVTYNYVMTGGNYKIGGGWTVDSANGAIVTGNSVLYVVGNVQINGKVTILPGATLKLYFFGDFDLGSAGDVKVLSGLSKDFQLIGLKEKSYMKLTGQDELTANIYAPGLDIDMAGQSQFYGNIVANTFFLTGVAQFHADESSGVLPTRYTIVSWREM